MVLSGPITDDAAALASVLRVSSVRLVKEMLTADERSVICDHCEGSLQSDDVLSPLKVVWMFLDSSVSETINLCDATGKTTYKLLVKILNKDKANGRADTAWR